MRAALLERLRAARARTDALLALLRPAAFLRRPIAERHRLVFYLGHLEAFDWNLLVRDCGGAPPRRPAWEKLFAFGIDPIQGGLPSEAGEDWPDAGAIRDWGASLRDDVDRQILEGEWSGWMADGWAANCAIEHRSMHAETLSYLIQRVPLDELLPAPPPRLADARAPSQELVRIPAGRATLGLSRAAHPHLGWDNEYEEHEQEVPAFGIERFAVSNADWLGFVEAGGYREERLWRPADWAWRERRGLELPSFWRRGAQGYRLRTLRSEIELPLSWPVYVSHAEASAYARWHGRQLPTEAQWHRAALGTPAGRERRYPWGEEPPVPGVHGNFGFDSPDPQPVDAHPRGTSAFGVHGLCGNGWQWTRSVFAPFPGFEPLPFYRGYSADFFDGAHFVLKGASPATDTTLLRRSFRNWFQPHYPYVYATLRCVEE